MILTSEKYSLFESVVVNGMNHTAEREVSYADFIHESNLIESAIYDAYNQIANAKAYAILEAANPNEVDPGTYTVDGKDKNNSKIKQLILDLKNLITNLFRTIREKIGKGFSLNDTFIKAKQKIINSKMVTVPKNWYNAAVTFIQTFGKESGSSTKEEDVNRWQSIIAKYNEVKGSAGETIKVKGSELAGLFTKLKGFISGDKKESQLTREADQATKPEDISLLKRATAMWNRMTSTLISIASAIMAKLKAAVNGKEGVPNA